MNNFLAQNRLEQLGRTMTQNHFLYVARLEMGRSAPRQRADTRANSPTFWRNMATTECLTSSREKYHQASLRGSLRATNANKQSPAETHSTRRRQSEGTESLLRMGMYHGTTSGTLGPF